MSNLHAFHLCLCRYVRRNVLEVQEDESFGPRIARLPDGLAERLDVSDEHLHYKKMVAHEGDHIPDAAVLAKESGGQQPLLLNDEEFKALERLTDLTLVSQNKSWKLKWEAAASTHDVSINCIKEIATGVSSQSADRWSSDSAMFARQLDEKGLLLSEGVVIIRKWAKEVRRYLQAMERFDLMPRPEGEYPTPTNLELQPFSTVEAYLRELDELKGTPYGQKMRAALKDCSPNDIHRLAEHKSIAEIVTAMRDVLDATRLRDKPMTAVRNWVKRKNESGVTYKGSKQQIELALRILNELGEYPGLGQNKRGQ